MSDSWFMPTARLPVNCRFDGFVDALASGEALGGDWDSLVIHLPPHTFVHCAAVAFLCAWGSDQRRRGRRLLLRGDDDTCRYLGRMDLHSHLGISLEEGHRQAETGRFLPLRLVRDGDAVFGAVNAICDLVLHQFDNAREFVPALEWAVNEIVDNILIHSETPVPGAVCAQYFPQRHRLDIAICDVGRGIKASLGQSRQLWSHGHAITTALERGVTRDPEVGQGNGMAGAMEIARQNGGGFEVWTGDVLFRLEHGEDKGFRQIPEVPGTGVVFSLDTRRPVDLTQTWIAADHGWSYINAEAERVSDEGLNVAANCSNTGTRPPAERLRRKILALLPEMTSPVILDFAGVERASSSFLDELLGRLAKELGVDAFRERILAVGMNAVLQQMGNVVVRQRLERDAVDSENQQME